MFSVLKNLFTSKKKSDAQALEEFAQAMNEALAADVRVLMAPQVRTKGDLDQSQDLRKANEKALEDREEALTRPKCQCACGGARAS